MTTLYVYIKEGKITVLELRAAIDQHDYIVSHGWKHTATIDPCLWIENLYNNPTDIHDAVKKLAQ